MILIAAVVAAATAAPAPAAPVARPIDPAALAAAGQLVQLLDIKGQLAAQGARTVEQMRAGVLIRAELARQPGFIPAYQANRAKMDPVLKKAGAIQAEIARKVIAEQAGTVIAAATRAYARNYSAAELNSLVGFYRSPIGQAFRTRQGRVEGEIGQASGQAIGSRIDTGMRAAQKQIAAALQPLNTIANTARK
jgi:uncharacterized protein